MDNKFNDSDYKSENDKIPQTVKIDQRHCRKIVKH